MVAKNGKVKKTRPKKLLGMPRGRPQEVVPKRLASTIIKLVSEGRSLNSICKQEPGMPAHPSTVLRWCRKDDDFGKAYARARQMGFELMADELLEIADANNVDTNRDRLRVDTRKWIMAKMLPKVFGDRTSVEHGGSVTLNVVTGVPEEEPDEILE
jgi:hypothetical protein